MPHGKMHVESGSAAPPSGRGARWPGDWLAARRRPGSFNIRAETRPAWRRPWWRRWCAIGQQMMATNNKAATQPVGNPASAPPFLRSLAQKPRQSRGQRQPNVRQPASRIFGSAQQPFRCRWPRGVGGWCAGERQALLGSARSGGDRYSVPPGAEEAAACEGRQAFAAPSATGAWATASSRLTLCQGLPPIWSRIRNRASRLVAPASFSAV